MSSQDRSSNPRPCIVISFKNSPWLQIAFGEFLTKTTITEKAFGLFIEARDMARLELPQDIETYTETLLQRAKRAYALARNIAVGKTAFSNEDEQKKAIDEECNLVSQFVDERLHEAFSKHLRI